MCTTAPASSFLALAIAAAPTAADEPLMVFAGAGFRLPIEACASRFEAESHVPVEVTFAGSGCLLAQAELAGRGDLFIPGERHYLDHAIARGLAADPTEIAYLRPVIAVRRHGAPAIASLEDLARKGLRIGLGDPTSVAVGIAAERWMKAALASATKVAIEANVRTRAINVNELGSQLALGALDAAIVWDVTVELFDDLVAIAPESALDHRTVITGGVLEFSKQPEDARAFLDFLAGPGGAAIFSELGYEPVWARELTELLPMPVAIGP